MAAVKHKHRMCDLKTINQTIDLKSGQTVILSGFQQSNRKTSKQGVITPPSLDLGVALTAKTATRFWSF